MLNQKEVHDALRSSGINQASRMEVSHFTLLLNKLLERYLERYMEPRLTRERIEAIVRCEIQKLKDAPHETARLRDAGVEQYKKAGEA
jgi:hypothetical protein